MKMYVLWIGLLMLMGCSEPVEQAPAQDQSQDSLLAPWQEGEHYVVLEVDATDTPQIREFFSFWCPHCYSYEPVVMQMKEKLSSNIDFQKVHVDFMGFASQEIQQQASEAMIIARHLGKENRVNRAIFEHIHAQGKALDDVSDIQAILLSNEISRQTFDDALTQADVTQKIEQHYQTFLKFRGELTSVPTFIVNGKYVAKFTNEMDIDEMIALLEWLANKS